MTTNRRDFLTAAVNRRRSSLTPDVPHTHDHEHQASSFRRCSPRQGPRISPRRKRLGRPCRAGHLDRRLRAQDRPRNGARVIARAWADPAYKQRLLANADAAIAELGYGGMQGDTWWWSRNTPQVHNMIVCTLCSCYPWPVLGLPPVWYKSAPYRSRSVIDPREC